MNAFCNPRSTISDTMKPTPLSTGESTHGQAM